MNTRNQAIETNMRHYATINGKIFEIALCHITTDKFMPWEAVFSHRMARIVEIAMIALACKTWIDSFFAPDATNRFSIIEYYQVGARFKIKESLGRL